MNEKLAHLTATQVKELMERYYSNTTGINQILVKEYKIAVTPAKLYRLFPNTVSEEKCQWCGQQLEMVPMPRTAISNGDTGRGFECFGCGHILADEMCSCKGCMMDKVNKERASQRRLRERIRAVYGKPVGKVVQSDSLSFAQKVYLGALKSGFLSEDLRTILPVDPLLLSPAGRLSVEIIDDLEAKKILVVDETSEIEAFVNSEHFPHDYYRFQVKYRINLETTGEKNWVINEWDRDAAYDLWKRIATEECIEYLLYQLKEAGFIFSPGEKTYAVFGQLLEHYAVSQIYGIIWGRVRNAAELYEKSTLTRGHVANTVIGACRSYGEQARVSNWELKKYDRIRDLPQTLISEFFFNRVLHIGELGFDMAPTLH